MILRTFIVKTDFSKINKNPMLLTDMNNFEQEVKRKIIQMYGGHPFQYADDKGLNLGYSEYAGNVSFFDAHKLENKIRNQLISLNDIFNQEAQKAGSPIQDLFHFQAFSFPKDKETVFVFGLGEGEPKIDFLKPKYKLS